MIPSVPALRRKLRRTVAETRYGYDQKIARRSARTLFRVLLVVAVFALMFTYHDSQRPEHKRIIRREVIKKQISQRLGPRNSDPRAWPGWKGIKAIYAFGDSQTDTGFNVRGPQPDEENPIGNPGYPGKTSSYGGNYLGHMTVTYNQSFIKTYNMANKWSPFFAKSEKMKLAPFHEQINNKFLKRYGPSTKPTLRSRQGNGVWGYLETLFVLYVGPDDIMHSFGDELLAKGASSVEENFKAYADGLEKLYEAGARNFLIVGYPQLENAPGIKSVSDLAGESKAYWRLGANIVQYNAHLAFMAHRFGEAHADANVYVFDTHKLSLTVRLEPTRYPETAMYNHLFGYCFPYADDIWWVPTESVFDPGCTDGLINYFWRDEFHYSEPFQRLMARQMVELLGRPEERLPMEFY